MCILPVSVNVILMNVEREEMRYWETKYSYKGSLSPPSYRIFERDRFLFQSLKENLRNKTMIEIGCLFPYEVIVTLNPSRYEYTYIGVDIARDALRAAKNYVFKGTFVRCSAINLPFRDGSFDVLLSLGVIHHLPGGSDNIPQLSRILRHGGLFAFAEAVERGTIGSLARLRSDSPSPHEDRLISERLIDACKKSGRIVHMRMNHSVVLGLFCLFMDFFKNLQNNNGFLDSIFTIDQLAIRTLGRVSSFFAPGAYFVIFRKS